MNEKIDYFALWQEPQERPKLDRKFFLNLIEDSGPVKKVKDEEVVFTQSDKVRRSEIQAIKSELYLLRTGEFSFENNNTTCNQKRRDELIHIRDVLRHL